MGDNQEEQRRKHIVALLQGLPTDYAARYAEITKISHLFHEAIAHSLEPALAKFADSNESDDLESRRRLVTTINEDLRKLHLAIRCPKTHRPAILIADSKDDHHKILRYRLQVHDDADGTVKTWTSREFPPLELMESQHRVENLSRLFRDASKKGRNR